MDVHTKPVVGQTEFLDSRFDATNTMPIQGFSLKGDTNDTEGKKQVKQKGALKGPKKVEKWLPIQNFKAYDNWEK